MKLSINPVLRITLEILALACLIFLLMKGCQHGRSQQLAIDNANAHYDSATKVLSQIKEDTAINNQQFNNTIGVLTAQYENLQQQKNESDAEADKLREENKQLITRYKAGYKDTNNVYVPTDFVTDCKHCFTNLEKETALLDTCRILAKRSDSIWLWKVTAFNKQLKKVQDQNNALTATLQDCINIGKATDKKLAPRSKVFMSIAAMWPNRLLPGGLGCGLIYQDKMSRQIGIMYFATNLGPLQTVHLNLPLSFKR